MMKKYPAILFALLLAIALPLAASAARGDSRGERERREGGNDSGYYCDGPYRSGCGGCGNW